MARKEDFDHSVPLPPGLTIIAIKKAIEYLERHLADLVEIYYEQANVFSGIVGIYGTKALDSVSTYERNRHIDTAQQRFPDLKRKGCGPNPKPVECLESKGSKRAWAIQSHYNHAGWYIIWRYLIDPTESLEKDKPVIIWRVDVVFLEQSDWKYEKSSAGDAGGGRTHTFGVKTPSTILKGRSLYSRSDVRIKDGKPVPINGHNELPTQI